MDIRKIKKLIELLKETGISEIEIKEGEESLRLSRHGNYSLEIPQAHYFSSAAVPRSVAPLSVEHNNPLPLNQEGKHTNSVPSGHKICSPMVGTIYTSPEPESPPFVSLGQTVNSGDVLCIVEAMKMFNEIEADRSGTIVEILVANEEPVEYNQVLFVIE